MNLTEAPGGRGPAAAGLTACGTAEHSDAIILFGPTGDLARKKLFPALYDLALAGRLNVPIVGVASSDWTLEQLCDRVRSSLEEEVDGARPRRGGLHRRPAELCVGELRRCRHVRPGLRSVGRCNRPVGLPGHPPSLFETVVKGLDDIGANQAGRVVVEKPFGRDLASARELNATLNSSYDDEQIFRIDHFLGKEPTLDLLVFRMANAMFHPAWDRHHIASVQITMAEDFGVEGRGRFYEEVGTIRDVVQNHLLQVLALIAMEPPIDTSARELAEEKMKVMRAMRTVDPNDVVRGQYDGYRGEDGVAGIPRWRPMLRCAPGWIRGAGRGCRSTSEPVRPWRSPPPRWWWSSRTPLRCSTPIHRPYVPTPTTCGSA